MTSDLHNLSYLQGLKLAHPISSMETLDISLLIGVDHYWQIVGNHIVRGEGPTAMQSKLGYLLSGPLLQKSKPESVPLNTYTMQTLDLELSDSHSQIVVRLFLHFLNRTQRPINHHDHSCIYTKETVYHGMRMGHTWYDSLGRKPIPSFHPTLRFVNVKQELWPED